ncbi:MAG: energy-coupling factor transporter ATPase [Anaerolineae bacterium]|nr:energy-coupling factor transporter ATPase [Anaerolineae bacterium]NIN99666.1 energy-coupling factor transporter ATPase [Anaerolineae bacterium]NIQ82519.1 energy-coupling factor transporter ATPase [Anaerolineae bacterium]
MIRIENLHYVYNAKQPNAVAALQGISLEIAEGEYVVIIGRNGSGKSTLAKHLNALLLPTEGDVWIRDMNTKDPEALRAIRHTVGMVFQVPDNQLVATVVEEDVAFGPENMGLPHAELTQRVDEALRLVDMIPHRTRPPHMLSAGQKQRVAIAGVMAMRPSYLVLDEATAMLDPQGRRDLLETMQLLHRQGITIITITHFMREAVEGTRVIVLNEGAVAMDGPPWEVFAEVEKLRNLGLDIPPVTQLARRLHQRQPSLPGTLLTVEQVVEQLCTYRQAVQVEA